MIITLFFTIFLTQILPAGANESKTDTSRLEIKITGFTSSDGLAMVSIANSEETYESEDSSYMGFMYKIIDNGVSQIVTIPYGEYAVKVFHDENTNKKMDTLMFGIPSEKYGFSNNARGTFGPPSFEDAKFTVNSPEQQISINVQ